VNLPVVTLPPDERHSGTYLYPGATRFSWQSKEKTHATIQKDNTSYTPRQNKVVFWTWYLRAISPNSNSVSSSGGTGNDGSNDSGIGSNAVHSACCDSSDEGEILLSRG